MDVNGENQNRKKKKIIGLTVALLLLVYVLIMVLVLVLSGSSSGNHANRKRKSETQTQETERVHIATTDAEIQKNTTSYDNGDYIYIPSEDHIFSDEEEQMIYYDNLITVYLDKSISEKQKDKIRKKVDGKQIASDLSGAVNMIDVLVASDDLAELKKKAEELENLDGVQYAMISFPIGMQNQNRELWDGETDIGNEASPSGTDWWAEAIGAYTAWDYEKYCSSVVVGILDDGFEVDHEDFQRDGESVLHVLNGNSPKEHGTHVAGLIAAQDNQVGSRGIIPSADVVCVEWKQAEENEDQIYMFTPAWMSESFKSMIEYAEKKKLPIVINNSWGGYLDEMTGFIDYYREQFGNFIASENGEEEQSAYSVYTSVCASEIVNQLMQYSKVEFLIVQAAGNGYANKGSGYSTKRTGWFCGVDESLKKQCPTLSFDQIKKHIMIVGAVENQEQDGKYKLTSFSNYGSNVDIVAPGMDVYSTLPDDDFGYGDGTSMAAPIVSGSAAYLWSLDPNLSAEDVRQQLIDTAGTAVKSVKEDKRDEYPMLNLGHAVNVTVVGTVSGELKDQDGEAITGAVLKRTCEMSDQEIFNADLNITKGNTFKAAVVGKMTLTFQKDGYQSTSRTVSVLPGQDLDLGTIVMQSEKKEETPDLDIKDPNMQTPEIKVTESGLEEFAQKYQYLCSKTDVYDGYIFRTTGSIDIQFRLDLEIQPLNYDIDDYDADGQNELLIINLEPYAQWNDSTVKLQMYEVENGKVSLAAEHRCELIYQTITGVGVLRNGDTQAFKYRKDNRLQIALEQEVRNEYFDGHGHHLFLNLEYNGKDFEVNGMVEEEFGAPDTEETNMEDMRQRYQELAIPVDVAQIRNHKKHVYDYIDDYIGIARSEYTFDPYGVENDKWCKFSSITFSKEE